MRIFIYCFATLLFVSCGNKVAPPESIEEEKNIDLSEYKLLSIDAPKV
jgi:hypothetical protein